MRAVDALHLRSFILSFIRRHESWARLLLLLLRNDVAILHELPDIVHACFDRAASTHDALSGHDKAAGLLYFRFGDLVTIRVAEARDCLQVERLLVAERRLRHRALLCHGQLVFLLVEPAEDVLLANQWRLDVGSLKQCWRHICVAWLPLLSLSSEVSLLQHADFGHFLCKKGVARSFRADQLHIGARPLDAGSFAILVKIKAAFLAGEQLGVDQLLLVL